MTRRNNINQIGRGGLLLPVIPGRQVVIVIIIRVDLTVRNLKRGGGGRRGRNDIYSRYLTTRIGAIREKKVRECAMQVRGRLRSGTKADCRGCKLRQQSHSNAPGISPKPPIKRGRLEEVKQERQEREKGWRRRLWWSQRMRTGEERSPSGEKEKRCSYPRIAVPSSYVLPSSQEEERRRRRRWESQVRLRVNGRAEERWKEKRGVGRSHSRYQSLLSLHLLSPSSLLQLPLYSQELVAC